MKLSVNTAEYFAAHGHSPKGRGSWVFKEDTTGLWFLHTQGSYQESLRAAKREAIRLNITRIRVGA